MCDEAKANIILSNLGPETRNLMAVGKSKSVEEVCEALRLSDEYQVGIIAKRIDAAKATESVAAMIQRLNATDAEIARLMKALNVNTTTTHQGTPTTNLGHQVTTTTSNQVAIRPKINPSGRSQNQRVYTTKQEADYEAWRAQHGDNVWFGCGLPVVGADPLGSNECTGCGGKDHRAFDCQFPKLKVLEQKLRKEHNDKAREERIAKRAVVVQTPTTIEQAHIIGDVDESGGARLAIEEGKVRGQE